MNASTVNQFATQLNALAFELETLRADASRLRKLSLWMLQQASARNALDMSVRDFMARCPATVRDAAHAVVREAQGARRAHAAAKAATPKRALRKLSKREQAALDKRLAEAERDAELLARMDLGDAIAYCREM